MDRDQPTRTPGPNETSPQDGDVYQDAPAQNDVAQGSPDPYASQIAGDFDEAAPAPQSVRPVAANDEGAQSPPTAAQNPNDIDAIRSERYQRYLKDLRAHEEAREQEPIQQTQRQPARRSMAPAPQPPSAPQPPQQTSAPQPQQPQQPPRAPQAQEPYQPQSPAAPLPPAKGLSDEAVEETIERYLETRPEQPAYQEPVQQQAPYQDGYADQSNQYRATDDQQPYLHENTDQQNQTDTWRDDIGSEFDERGGLYADGHVPVEPKKKRRPFLILAALLGVGLVGGGVYYAYDQGLQGIGKNLPVVTAETTPTKVAPKDPGGTKIPQQTKLIYDRIVGEEVVVKEKIVSREEQVASTPVQSPPPPPSPVAQPDTPSLPPVAVVPAAPQLPSAQRTVTPSAPPAPAEPDLPQVTITPPGSPPPPPAPRAVVAPPPPVQTAPPTPRARPSAQAPARTQIPSAPSGPIRLTPPPPPPPPSAVAQTRQAAAPRALTPPAQTRAVQAPPVGANDYLIQVASYRSEGEANNAFAKLKQRHASLLQNYGPLIQRADLGDKGIYFRLRVGPINGKQAASDLCGSLISAGQKGCIVRKR